MTLWDPAPASQYYAVLYETARIAVQGTMATLVLLAAIKWVLMWMEELGLDEGRLAVLYQAYGHVYYRLLPGEDWPIGGPRGSPPTGITKQIAGACVAISVGILLDLAFISAAAGWTMYQTHVLGTPTEFTSLAHTAVACAILATASLHFHIQYRVL